jgi:hypothetical protein
MTNTVYVPNIVQENGKTVRENNLQIPHKIPLKTFVEINLDYNESHGCRGFVVDYQRDCDGEPLYGISMDPSDADHIANMQNEVDNHLPEAEAWLRLAKSSVNGGWSTGCLIILRKPDQPAEDMVTAIAETVKQSLVDNQPGSTFVRNDEICDTLNDFLVDGGIDLEVIAKNLIERFDIKEKSASEDLVSKLEDTLNQFPVLAGRITRGQCEIVAEKIKNKL